MSKVETNNLLENKHEDLKESVVKASGNTHTNIFYGDSSEVNVLGFQDYNEYINNKQRKQSMEGFDPNYLDIVDYIIKCTHRIWEERDFGLIYTHYHNDTIIHSGTVNTYGINHVLSSSIQMQHAFPDRKVVGENVIWSGNDKDGFYSSHRVLSYGTNLGDTAFGAATNKKAAFRVIADCVVHSNRIVEEWLIRDYLAIVTQLGFNPVEVAKRMAQKIQSNPNLVQTSFSSGDTMKGQLVPNVYSRKSSKFDVGEFVLEMYNKIWEWRLFSYINDFYADNAIVHYICNKEFAGVNQIQGMIISLISSFPCAKFIVERVTCNQSSKNNEWDVSVRWRIQGLHEGIGYFGRPSDKPVEILGASHLKVKNEKVVEEWIVFDGIDVLRQIHTPTTEGVNPIK